MTIRELRVDADLARKISAMLYAGETGVAQGKTMPVGWHFPLMGCETARQDLRSDGFPGLGVPMPDLGLPRTAAAGRTVHFNRPLQIGTAVTRSSRIASIKHKDGTAGPLAIVTVAHDITEAGSASDQPPAIYEEQTYVLLSASFDGLTKIAEPGTIPGNIIKSVTPDETLLFQFSALSFNSHKIHLDRDFARKVERYPDLVVNGGLVTLLMTEIVRLELGRDIRSLTLRNKSPLFCNRPITFVAEESAAGLRIAAHDHEGRLAAEMEAATNDF